MTLQFLKRAVPSFLIIFLMGLGCGQRSTAPPAPIAVEELPAALQKAFAKAKSPLKDLASQAVEFLQAKDYGKAYQTVQNLTAQSGLNKQQIEILTRGSMALNTALQAAQSHGDQKAAETLNTYRINK
jgi:hypothetical protein